MKYWDVASVTSDGSKAGSSYNSVPSQGNLTQPYSGLPSFSWETGSELPTLMDLEKMVDERGFEPPASSLRTRKNLR